MRTSGTVTTWDTSTSSCRSRRASTSARAWRTSSATRCWRCEGPVFCSKRLGMTLSGIGPDRQAGACFCLLSSMSSSPEFPGVWTGACPREETRWPGHARPSDRLRGTGALQRPLHLFDAVALDDVADAHVLVVLERHAALLAGRDLARIVLKAFELRQPALVDHDVVANEPHVGAALDDAVEDAAARD